MQYRVKGYVHSNENTPSKHTLKGTVTFHSNDYETADWFARNIAKALPDGCSVPVDIEMNLRIGYKSTWVDANPRALDDAAEQLMRAASEMRGKRTAKTNGKVLGYYDDEPTAQA